MRRAALAIAGLLCACDTPPLKLVYRVADGTPGQSCGTTECKDIYMPCESVLSVRILRPSDPTAPFVSVCQAVQPDNTNDLCAIGKIDLPAIQLPREVLEVQVTVWPKSAVTNQDGDLDCLQVPVKFDASLGFPVDLGPALGGRAYYHPGDTETLVTLGCTDLATINNATCTNANSYQVTSTVVDFDTAVSVSDVQGNSLSLAVGEPTAVVNGAETTYVIKSSDARPLNRTVSGPVPAWGAAVDIAFVSTACIEVLEDGAQATTSIRCGGLIDADKTNKRIDLAGVRMSKATLQQILTALSLSNFPDAGLTIGVVLDLDGTPAAGVSVTSNQGTVEYLNFDRTGLVPGGTMTTASGVFVSRDAPYGTHFSGTFLGRPFDGIGGLVDGKLTIVKFEQPSGN